MTLVTDHPVRWIPLAEAAGRCGTTHLNLLMHIKRGLLLGREEDGAWLVEVRSLDALIERRSHGERSELCSRGCRNSKNCGECP